jgi:hypothetical protein
MIPDWIILPFVTWAIVAAALLFISWPYADLDSVPRRTIIRDCLGWPWWFLVIMVEATEEARRRIK